MNSDSKSIFLPYHPPSVNSRLGKGRYGNSYLKTKSRNFQTIIEREFKNRFGDKTIIQKKKLWQANLAILGDWGSYEDYIVQEYKVEAAFGNLGDDKMDLDNMVKDVIDALKKVTQNDDRYVNEIHLYKIQWPQKKGVIISFSENRYYEAIHLPALGVSEEIMRQIL